MKIAADEVQRVSADPRHSVRYEVFDFLDGMPGTPHCHATAPLHRRRHRRPTVVLHQQRHRLARSAAPEAQRARAERRGAIRSWRTGGTIEPGPGLQLPIRTRNLQIDYTALSLSIPERVRFRYQLGAEPWQDAGPRRAAYFTNLAPGDYTFRVTAANDDGVWNKTGASIQFTIPPAFYQTRWFYALCALACLGILTVSYRVRVRQVAAQVRGRLEARLAERERIARELHDTLLQGMQGLIWRFQAAADRIPADAPARQLMEQSLDRADELLGESRDKVKDLRPATSEGADLAQALAAEGEQFAQASRREVPRERSGHAPRPASDRARGRIHHRPRGDGNAFRHADARDIEAEVTYGDMALHVRIRDDGRGISAAVLDAGGKPGHFGLLGMRERAKKLGAHLEVWSKPGAGTEVDLRVPADVAYKRAPAASRRIRSWLGATS